jgi:hypothetical protein
MKKKPSATGSTIGKGKKAADNNADRELSEKELAEVGGGRAVVSGGVLNGKAISKPQPAYPPIA